MGKKVKIVLGVVTGVAFLMVASKFLIEKSHVAVPTFYVLIVKNQIKVGEPITAELLEPMVIPGSLVKNQSFYWSTDGISETEKSAMIAGQIQKVVGKTASKPFYRGDQITINGFK